jgi:hypothetical protein
MGPKCRHELKHEERISGRAVEEEVANRGWGIEIRAFE